MTNTQNTLVMKIFNTKIECNKIICSNPFISEQFYIESYNSTTMDNDVYVWSDNGFCSVGRISFNGDVAKALKFVEKVMSNYFTDRCENNPKGF